MDKSILLVAPLPLPLEVLVDVLFLGICGSGTDGIWGRGWLGREVKLGLGRERDGRPVEKELSISDVSSSLLFPRFSIVTMVCGDLAS